MNNINVAVTIVWVGIVPIVVVVFLWRRFRKMAETIQQEMDLLADAICEVKDE